MFVLHFLGILCVEPQAVKRDDLGLIFWIPIGVTLLISLINLIWNLLQQRTVRENAKHLLIHELQFKKEFEIHENLWKILFDLSNSIRGLTPEIDVFPNSKTQEEVIMSRLQNVIEIETRLRNEVDEHKPFYPADTYAEVKKLQRLMANERFRVSINFTKQKGNYWEEQEENLKMITDQAEVVCESIRKRVTR